MKFLNYFVFYLLGLVFVFSIIWRYDSFEKTKIVKEYKQTKMYAYNK